MAECALTALQEAATHSLNIIYTHKPGEYMIVCPYQGDPMYQGLKSYADLFGSNDQWSFPIAIFFNNLVQTTEFLR